MYGKILKVFGYVDANVHIRPLFYPISEVGFMGKQSTGISRGQILRRLSALAGVKVNDVVQLAYLSQEEANRIAELDLKALKEFKRGANGTVEMKLIDRVEVLKTALELLQEQEQTTGSGFLQALEQAGQESAGE